MPDSDDIDLHAGLPAVDQAAPPTPPILYHSNERRSAQPSTSPTGPTWSQVLPLTAGEFDATAHLLDHKPPSNDRRSLNPVACLGAALGLAGLIATVIFGWTFYGSNLLGARHQRATVTALRAAWSAHRPEVATHWGTAFAILSSPALGAAYEAPILTGSQATSAGVRIEAGSPGARGNFVVTGDRFTNGRPLRSLIRLQTGDIVAVETSAATYTYTIVVPGTGLRVPVTDSWPFTSTIPINPDSGPEPPQDPGGSILTIATTPEPLHHGSQVVVFAVLTQTVPTHG